MMSIVSKETIKKPFLFSFQYHNVTFDWAYLSKKECVKYGGKLVGNNCDFVPDITLMSFILFLGTYTSSMAMKKFKTSRYFPTTVSSWGINNFRSICPVSPLMRFCKMKKRRLKFNTSNSTLSIYVIHSGLCSCACTLNKIIVLPQETFQRLAFII